MRFRDHVAGQQSWAAHVCFGSKADITARLSDVRFTPKADIGTQREMSVWYQATLCGRMGARNASTTHQIN
jgi:hypothetical protein